MHIASEWHLIVTTQLPSSYQNYGKSGSSSNADRSAAYGRDRDGCRLLPVMIKDVAGLVPGAYKGRGKGMKVLLSSPCPLSYSSLTFPSFYSLSFDPLTPNLFSFTPLNLV